jgi:hypothetical protein
MEGPDVRRKFPGPPGRVTGGAGPADASDLIRQAWRGEPDPPVCRVEWGPVKGARSCRLACVGDPLETVRYVIMVRRQGKS